jgi:hypothetical protein
MQLDRLLLDSTGLPAGTSKNQQYSRLAAMLSEAEDSQTVSVKTVEAWFLRKSIPSARLMKIASVAQSHGRPINLTEYA